MISLDQLLQQKTLQICRRSRLLNADDSQKLNVITIEPGDVSDKVMNLRDGKAPGDDGIIPEFLKKSCV